MCEFRSLFIEKYWNQEFYFDGKDGVIYYVHEIRKKKTELPAKSLTQKRLVKMSGRVYLIMDQIYSIYVAMKKRIKCVDGRRNSFVTVWCERRLLRWWVIRGNKAMKQQHVYRRRVVSLWGLYGKVVNITTRVWKRWWEAMIRTLLVNERLCLMDECYIYGQKAIKRRELVFSTASFLMPRKRN